LSFFKQITIIALPPWRNFYKIIFSQFTSQFDKSIKMFQKIAQIALKCSIPIGIPIQCSILTSIDFKQFNTLIVAKILLSLENIGIFK